MIGDLPDEIKARVQSEELYRLEVRRRLKAPAQKPAPSWVFLNSALGLWFLSAIFLSGGGAIYAKWEKDKTDEGARRERSEEDTRRVRAEIERLDFEISYRFSQGLGALERIREQTSRLKGLQSREGIQTATLETADAVGSLVERPASNPLYAEYSTFALPTLMGELHRRLMGQEKAEVESAVAVLMNEGKAETSWKDPKDPATAAASRLLHPGVILRRWKVKWFHFVDCPPESPFC